LSSKESAFSFNPDHIDSLTNNSIAHKSKYQSYENSGCLSAPDNRALTLICGEDMTFYTDPGSCYAFLTITSAPNCDCTIVFTTYTILFADGNSVFGSGLDASTIYPLGVSTITFTAEDDQANTYQCSQQVTVVDGEAPTFSSCPQSASLLVADGDCYNPFLFNNPTISDNCSSNLNYSVSLSDPTIHLSFLGNLTFGTFPVGNTVVTLSTQDGSNNTSECEFTVTIVDAQQPTLTSGCMPDTLIYTNSDEIGNNDCFTTFTWVNPIYNDNCFPDTLSVLFTAHVDNPAITLPPNMQDVLGSDSSSTVFNAGKTVVTYICTDESGNMNNDCSFIIEVADNEAPVSDVDTLTASGECSVTLTPPTATDNCEGLIVGTTTDPTTYSVLGSYSVTWTYDDGNGNSSMQNQNVVVNDITAPVAACQNITIFLDSTGNATITAIDIDNGSSDNCEAFSLGVSKTMFTCLDFGVNSVVLTVVDSSGNVDSCITTVIVQDTNIVCPWPSVRVYVDSSKTGGENMGIDWDNALLTLADAIAVASQYSNVEEIWVAGATYYPTVDTDRSSSFILLDDIKVYGGFAGNESLLGERDVDTNPTTLSGDIGLANDISDNTYQLISVPATVTNAVLDGFLIRDGNANESVGSKDIGAGIYCAGQLNIENCTITNCEATAGSAAIHNFGINAYVILKNCTIDNNNSVTDDDLGNTDGASMALQGENTINN